MNSLVGLQKKCCTHGVQHFFVYRLFFYLLQ